MFIFFLTLSLNTKERMSPDRDWLFTQTKNLKSNLVKLASQPNGLLKIELLDIKEAVFGWDWIVNIHTIMQIIDN